MACNLIEKDGEYEKKKHGKMHAKISDSVCNDLYTHAPPKAGLLYETYIDFSNMETTYYTRASNFRVNKNETCIIPFT